VSTLKDPLTTSPAERALTPIKPGRDGTPGGARGAAADDHADVTERRRQELAVRQRRGQRPGRARRHDPVPRRHDDERGAFDRGAVDGAARDLPEPSRRKVGAVPAGERLAGGGKRHRHAVVEPVLERDEGADFLARRIERRELLELLQREKRVERGEKRLENVDRDLAQRTEGGAERLGESADDACEPLVLGVEVPGRGEKRERGDVALAALRKGDGE